MLGAAMTNEDCVGNSPALKCVVDIVKTIATRECTVMLCGESGTGKELVARMIHRLSHRNTGPFIPVDCSNLTGDLLASELFGHVKGAFTGADRDTLGFFRAADEGTIFLDEIGELCSDVQAKLLRVLQEARVTPVGSTKSHLVNVRVICATNANLEEMVAKGAFRSDLYYRIHVVEIRIPPLRERREDILPLAEHFLRQQARLYNESSKKLANDTQKRLLDYTWPGNVRELANAIEHAYVLSTDDVIKPAALPMEITTTTTPAGEAPFPTLGQANKHLITKALEHTDGRKMAAARLLGMERRRLNRMIHDLGVEVAVLKK